MHIYTHINNVVQKNPQKNHLKISLFYGWTLYLSGSRGWTVYDYEYEE